MARSKQQAITAARAWSMAQGRCALLLLFAGLACCRVHAQQNGVTLPDAPAPQLASRTGSADTGSAAQRSSGADNATGAGYSDSAILPQIPSQRSQTRPGFPPVSPPAPARPLVPLGSRSGIPSEAVVCLTNACSPAQAWMNCQPDQNLFARFLESAAPHPLTPRQKLVLASKNVIDPFNLLTIVGEAGLTIGSDPDTHYGPGLRGFAKYAGTSLTSDMVGEALGTFLIPSVMHQDPHYHRMPNVSMQRRIFHAVYQVVWTQSDSGKGMFNYAAVFGTIGSDALGDVYIAGRKQGVGPSATRVATGLATAPIGNFITEFLPDLARHVNIRVVIVQRIINRVAITPSVPPA